MPPPLQTRPRPQAARGARGQSDPPRFAHTRQKPRARTALPRPVRPLQNSGMSLPRPGQESNGEQEGPRLSGRRRKKNSERGGSGRAGRRVPEATGGARIAGRAHRGPHSACRLTRPAPSGPRCHRPGRPSSGGRSVHPSVTLTGRPGDDEDRSLGRPAGLPSSNFRLPGAVASNNSPARGTTAPARRA